MIELSKISTLSARDRCSMECKILLLLIENVHSTVRQSFDRTDYRQN